MPSPTFEQKPSFQHSISWAWTRRASFTLSSSHTLPYDRSAPAGLDRLTGKRATQPRQTPAKFPENPQGFVERRGSASLGASHPGQAGGRNRWPEEIFTDLRPGFSGNKQATLSSTFLHASTSPTARGGKAPRQRPKTATAAGRTRAESWRDRDLRDEIGGRGGFSRSSGASAASRRRPRSASSRFHTSTGRSRGRAQDEEGVDNGGGDREDPGVSGQAGSRGLPEGWAEAVDEDSGHVYYYSEKR